PARAAPTSPMQALIRRKIARRLARHASGVRVHTGEASAAAADRADGLLPVLDRTAAWLLPGDLEHEKDTIHLLGAAGRFGDNHVASSLTPGPRCAGRMERRPC